MRKATTRSGAPLPRPIPGALLLLLAACSSAESTLIVDESRDAGAGSDQDGRGSAGDGSDAGGRPIGDTQGGDDASAVPDTSTEVRLTGASVVPADSVVRTGLNVPATLSLVVWGEWSDGRVEPLVRDLPWTSDNPERVTVARNGTATITGALPGVTTVRTQVEELEVTAQIRVQLTQQQLLDGLGPDVVAALESPIAGTTAAAPQWQYPEDGTLFPAGMVPPVLQWNANGNTLFHLRMTRSDDVLFDVYTTQPNFTFSEPQWDALAMGYGEPIVLELSGRPGIDVGEVNIADARILYTADASLAGTVYYWQVETGDIMKIPQGDTSPTPVFSTNAETGTCRGCHSLSRDGGTLGFMYNGGDDPRAGLASTASPEPSILENFTENRWTMVGFDPSGTRAAAVHNGSMWLADVTPGIAGGVANLGPINTGGQGTMPAWSPDGSTLAIARRGEGADWSFSQSELCLMPWNSATGAFGDPRVIASGDGPEGDAYSYPTWTPDSRWLAFGRAPNTGNADPQTLWMYHLATGTASRLLRANPQSLDVQPAFSPYIEGGYYWLLFYSRRPYGQFSTHKQLWVTAIRTDMAPGEDGSFPAFWLPGQDPNRQNITGYWSPPTCTTAGDVCKTADECCSGQECVFSESAGTTTCQDTACVRDSLPCSTTDDCCDGSECRESLNGAQVCQRR